MTLDDARKIVAKVSETLDDDAKIIWGAQILEDLDKVVKTMVVITGVKSDQIRGKKRIEESKNEKLDDFIDNFSDER